MIDFLHLRKQRDSVLLFKQEAHNLSKWQHISGLSHATMHYKYFKPVYNTDTVILVACIFLCCGFASLRQLLLLLSYACDSGFAQKQLLPLFSDVVSLPAFPTSRCSLSPKTVSHRCSWQTQPQTQNDSSPWVICSDVSRAESLVMQYEIFSKYLQFCPLC